MINVRAVKRLETKLKRQSQKCQVFEIKLDKSKLSKKSLDHLCKIFLEAKWYYNYVISNKDINDAETKIKQVPVKVEDGYEVRDLEVLTAQMRQDIKSRTFGSLKALKQLKQNGYKVGLLKFKKRVNSVPLRQLRRTFDLDFENSRIRIQGLKDWLRVRGLGQISQEKEIANATLVRKSNDFYINVTTFEDKQEQSVPEQAIGIDFGCETQLTLSDGTKLEFQVPVSKRLKRLDRKINRKQSDTGKKRPYSKKKRQDQIKRQKAYERLTNRKSDIRNKIVSGITKNYKYVVFQDESIRSWHSGNHGKKVQHSGIGAILRDLKNKSVTPIMVDKFFPSTQLCPSCGIKNKMPEWKREYKCECGFVEDRDIKSACCILEEGLKQIPMDRRELKARENVSSTYFDSICGIKVSKMCSMN
jgi:putative transposase